MGHVFGKRRRRGSRIGMRIAFPTNRVEAIANGTFRRTNRQLGTQRTGNAFSACAYPTKRSIFFFPREKKNEL